MAAVRYRRKSLSSEESQNQLSLQGATVLPGEVVPNQFRDTNGACFDPYLAIETSYDHNFFLNVPQV